MFRVLGYDPIDADIPGYEILGATGQGAMGRVFVARQIALGRRVAIKFLSIDHDSDPAERIARFRREAAIMAGLSHPNVVSIHDFGEVDERPYLVMEYVEDGDLRKRMPESSRMEPSEVLATVIPIGEALGYLHSRGILHRDLKPENILMHGDTPKVADFGIAVERSGSGELTRSAQGLGTLGYVAPELQFRLPVDERADQYSLAAMVYEMLTGQRPLGIFKPPSHHNDRVNNATDGVVLRALEENPSDRFATVQEFTEALRTSIETRRPKAPNSHASGGIVIGLLIASCLLGVAFRSWWMPASSLKGTGFIPPAAAQPSVLPLDYSNLQPVEFPIWPEPKSPECIELISRKANAIWKSQGSPTGEEGNAVSKPNWHAAVDVVTLQVSTLATTRWLRDHRDPELVRPDEIERVWGEAARELLQTTEHPENPPRGDGR